MNQLAPYAAAAGGLGLIIAFLIYFSLKRQPAGTQGMQDLAEALQNDYMASYQDTTHTP